MVEIVQTFFERQCLFSSPEVRVVTLRLVTEPAPSKPPPPVRLTRRGRALVRSLVLLAVVLAALIATKTTPMNTVMPVASRGMVVSEGDTLWSIAERAAPGQPLDVTMAQIQTLNHMPDATVHVGEHLLLPVTPRDPTSRR